MKLRAQSGLSLIEVTLVLAIGSLLFGGLMTYAGSLHQYTAFTTELDKINQQIHNAQAEAQSGEIDPYGSTGQSDNVIFGKIVEFNDGTPGQMTISTLVAEDPQNVSASTLMSKCDTRTVPFGQGITYNNPGGLAAIIFTVRNKGNSNILPPEGVFFATNTNKAHHPLPELCSSAGPYNERTSGSVIFNTNKYLTGSAFTSAGSIPLISGSYTATIKIDPKQNSVTRTIP